LVLAILAILFPYEINSNAVFLNFPSEWSAKTRTGIYFYFLIIEIA